MQHILLVIDNWEKLERYEERFTQQFQSKYMIHCSAFGDHGLEMALEFQPALIVLDLHFENMTADEFQKNLRLQKSLASCPLICFSDLIKKGPYDQIIEEPLDFKIIQQILAKQN